MEKESTSVRVSLATPLCRHPSPRLRCAAVVLLELAVLPRLRPTPPAVEEASGGRESRARPGAGLGRPRKGEAADWGRKRRHGLEIGRAHV